MKTKTTVWFKSAAMITASLISLTPGVYAAAGTEGAAFLGIPVGAGPTAMGSAYTALATDAYAPVYNPAGLASLKSNEIAGQHLSYLESMHYEHVSYVHPFGKDADGSATKGLGFSIQYLGSGDMDRVDIDAANK